MGMNIYNSSSQNSYSAPQPTINGTFVVPKTLEDLRDTTNKSFAEADLEKLMEKYDPDAYAEYSKLPDMIGDASHARGHFMSQWMQKIKKGLNDGTISSDGSYNAAGSKRSENKGYARTGNLQDLKDVLAVGKSVKVTDIEKVMKKYDPDAYAEYSKLPDSAGDASHSRLHYLSKWMDKMKKALNDGTVSSNGVNNASKSNESQLSKKAQEFLKNLRKQYGKYDFFVGNSTDNLKALAKSGNKEFSIIFSNEELEKMANDADYAKEKLQSMEQAVKMSEQISKQFGHGKAGSEVTKIGIVFNEDGTTSFFAEMEKTNAKQREHLEKTREEKRAAQKEEAKKAEKGIGSYAKNRPDTKRVSVEADSIEELLKKIREIDWDDIKAEKIPQSGGKYDFSI